MIVIFLCIRSKSVMENKAHVTCLSSFFLSFLFLSCLLIFQTVPWPLAFLQRLVDQDNHKFEEWCSEMANMRKQSVDKGKAKHEEVKELYELLPARDGR